MKHRLIWGVAVLALGALVFAGCGGGEEAAPAASAPASAPAPAASGSSGSGKITGSIAFSGEDPDRTLDMNADPVCAGMHSEKVTSQRVAADGGGLANVFVYVKSGVSGSYPAPSEPATLRQHGCLYEPHVQGMQVGQTLKVVNGDPTLHNVHATPASNTEFNQAQPFQDMELEKVFDKAEVMVPFKCDVHPWMSAYIGVVNHPFFAVSDAGGNFSIEGLPAGTYTVEAWHETLGTQSAEVTVEDGGAATTSFTFGA